MASNLRRRDGRYSFRRAIPLDLQKHYGRAEMARALGTSDPAQAKLLAARLNADWEEEFLRLRRARQQAAAPFLDPLDWEEQVEGYEREMSAHAEWHAGEDRQDARIERI